MPGIGESVVKLASLVNQNIRDPVTDHHGAQRLIARGDALCQCHQVGPESKALVAKPVPQPAETADHLVRHQQDAVVIADPLNLRPVGCRRDDDAAGTLDGLADEGGHLVGAKLFELLLQAARRLDAVLGGRKRTAVFVPVRLFDVHDARNRHPALLVHRLHATQACAGHGAAVIRILPADDDLPAGLAEHIPIPPHHPHDGVVRLGSRACVKHAAELCGRDLRKQAGELDGGGCALLKKLL